MQNLILPFFLLYFAIVWIAALWLIARLGGWSALAAKFRVKHLPVGMRRDWQSASLSRNGFPSNYGSCLTMMISEQGLGLQVFPLFRFGHPPLLVPWSEFYNPRKKTVLWYWRFVEAEIGEPAIVTITLPEWTLEQANAAMKGSL